MKKNYLLHILFTLCLCALNISLVQACEMTLNIDKSTDSKVSYYQLTYTEIASTCGFTYTDFPKTDCTFSSASGISNVSKGDKAYVINNITSVTSGSKMTFTVSCPSQNVNETVIATVGKNNTPKQYEQKYGSTSSSTLSTDTSYDGDECNYILGATNDSGGTDGVPSVAYVLQKVFKLIQISGPILVIALSIMDLIKVVTSSDKDAMSKFLRTLVKRIIYAVLLFVLPSLLNFFLEFISAYGTCGIG